MTSEESRPDLTLDEDGVARLADPSLSGEAWIEMSNFPTSLMNWR